MTVARRLLLTLTTVVVAISVLSGCLPSPNAGTAGAEALEAAFIDDPAVADVHTSAANDLPFAGTFSGTLITHDDADYAALLDLATRASEYLRTHTSNSARLTALLIRTHDVLVTVDADSEITQANIVVGAQLSDNPLVIDAWVDVTSHVEVEVAEPTAVTTLARTIQYAVEETAAPTGFAVDLASTDGLVSLSGTYGAWVTLADEVWTTIAAPTARFEATPQSFTLTVPYGTDMIAATEAAEALLSGTNITFVVDEVDRS